MTPIKKRVMINLDIKLLMPATQQNLFYADVYYEAKGSLRELSQGLVMKIEQHFPLLEEIFGDPAIKHKFVKGLEGREGVRIFRKSGTWRDYHADSGLVERDGLAYIVVAIDQHPEAGRGMVEGIRIIDDVMLERAGRKRSASPEQ